MSSRTFINLDPIQVEDNFPNEVISKKLFIGSRHAAYNFSALQELNITHVCYFNLLCFIFERLKLFTVKYM